MKTQRALHHLLVEKRDSFLKTREHRIQMIATEPIWIPEGPNL